MLSVIVLTKNEGKTLQNCINSVSEIAGEIIVIDNGSTDHTLQIAKDNMCIILESNDPSFAVRRELGLSVAKGEWILYLDADERVTPELAIEIKSVISKIGVIEPEISNPDPTNYLLNRRDYYFGTQWPALSPMHRLFLRSALRGWQGVLHETPIVEGETGSLQHELIHLTHTDIDSMMTNTIRWSSHEAQLRFDTHHPPIVWWRLIRVLLTAWYNSYFTQKGYTKGTVGWIESIYQGCSMFFTYAKLWELQNQDQIASSYAKLEQNFAQKAPEHSSSAAK